MTYHARRLLFLFSIFVFLALSGPLLLYTFGYRFSLSNFDIHKTGGIFVHTNPPGTSFVIGDIERTTSYLTGNAFIQNLRPAPYMAWISRENYQSWEKTIDVEPQSVTEIFPVLMPVVPTVAVLKTASSTNMRASPQASLLILHHAKNTKHAYEFFDPNLLRTIPFTDTSSQSLMASVPPNAIWSWNALESTALIETPDNWLELTRQDNIIRVRSLYNQMPLPRLITQDPRNLNSYFLLDGTNFARWNSETRAKQQLLQSIAGFFVGDSYLILWDMQSGLPQVTTLDATQPRPYATSSLPVIIESRIQQIGDTLLLISNKGTWLLSNIGNPAQLLTNSSNPQNILHTDAYILWWNNQEISIHWISREEQLPSFQKNKQEILYKSSGTIQNVMPYPEEHYVIIQEDNTIYTLELDGRGGTRNKHILYKGNKPSFFAPPQKKILYVFDGGSLFAIDLP
ncbi:MAG: hypothetical protein A3H64_03215 [Candidatus Ryanbacteria bacterium RIFCSPLOWO2_02_FULL_45_11c]|uniref:PEGA domain-containing protein n=1 Tax=Candidatus Ryanbacteria bacterium RIFCSPLOWO2_02_FULL_45_11c TaxID=1802128 RepID=A0A1G2GVC1_9BACT|nr:MAG: hypothetical protein A3H64_03215 [Candidatus Ryanbacteria bacterium RIFCSPLOWO2_02_FULL_45_11c]